jgi:tRNA-Thr(GGU) m(6)t(6)A37 methyltransferase TsaA
MKDEMRLRAVGIVRTPKSREGLSLIEIAPDLDGILDGIEEFSHLQVLYWANLREPCDPPKVRTHPFGDEDLPLTGIFATRSPARPNPVLSTVVRLVGRDGATLTVAGLDALEGSPVIDIKPSIRGDHPAEGVRVAPWLDRSYKGPGGSPREDSPAGG